MPFNHPGTIKKNRRGANMRRDPVNNRPPKTSAIRIVSASAAGSVLTVEFNQAVMPLKGAVPGYTTDVVGAEAVSATMSTPTTVQVTFSASIAAATEMIVPYEEPAIRNLIGGFVADSTFPV